MIDQPLRGEYSRGRTGLGVGDGGKTTFELKGYEDVAAYVSVFHIVMRAL